MKTKTNQLDQTSDWREPKFTDYKSYQSGDEEVIELNETSFDDLVQSLLSSQEQRHQREVSDEKIEVYKKIVWELEEIHKTGHNLDILKYCNLLRKRIIEISDQISQSIKEKVI